MRLTQGTKEWVEMRRNYIGASDAAAIMEVSPWKTPYQLWQEKLGLHTPVVNGAMVRGTNMEDSARREFEMMTGYTMTPQVVFSEKFDWMMASLDGITPGGDAIVEIKCPGKVDHQAACEGIVPEKYIPQLQHQLSCTGLDMAYYFSFDGTAGVVLEVERDDVYLEELHTKEAKFWDCVVEFDAPPLIGKDYRLREDALWLASAQKYIDVKEQLKTLEEQESHLRKLLINMADDVNSMGGGIKLSRGMRKGIVDYKKIPDLIGVDLEYYRKSPSEVWRISTQ